MDRQTTTVNARVVWDHLSVLLVFGLMVVALLVGLPALLVGVVGSVGVCGWRGMYRSMAILTVLGVGLIVLWHADLWGTLLADRDVVQAVLSRSGRYHLADVWPMVRSVWARTWPAAPAVAVALEAMRHPTKVIRKPMEAEQEPRQRQRVRRRQEARSKAAYVQAARAPDSISLPVTSDAPPQPVMVLGAAGPGDALRIQSAPQWAVYSQAALHSHGVILGENGTGKSELLLRLAYGARKVYGWRVYCIDAKGNSVFANQFRATMRKAGVDRFGMFPHMPMDGWRGTHEMVYNKLIVALDLTEPFYKNVVETITRLVVWAEDTPPRNSSELLRRLERAYLLDCYAYDARSLQQLKRITDEQFTSVALRFGSLLAAAGSAVDGEWSFEDVDAGYFLFDAVTKREQARSLGRFVLEDFVQAIRYRLPKGEHALLLIDDYPALVSADAVARLFVEVRSPQGTGGAGVFVTAQSYADLGEDADRLLYAANTTICFRQSDTQRLVIRAGRHTVVREEDVGRWHTLARLFALAGVSGSRSAPFAQGNEGSASLLPDAIRHLDAGQCYVLGSGNYQKVTVSRVPLSDAEMVSAAATNSIRAVPRSLSRNIPLPARTAAVSLLESTTHQPEQLTTPPPDDVCF